MAPARNPLPFLCVGHAYDHMFMLLYPTVVLALEAPMNMSYGELISLATVGFILFGAAAPLAGWLADRWSAVGMMTVFFIGIGLSTMLTGLADGPLTLTLGLSLTGFFAAIYHPVGTAMVIQTAGDKRGRNLAISGVFGSFGLGLAALVAGGLTDLVGWRLAFLVPGAVSVATGLWFWVAFRQGLPVIIDKGRHERPSTGQREFWRIMTVIAVITVCTGTVFQATTIGLPKVIDLRVAFLDRQTLMVGGVVSAILLIGGLGQFLGGWLADRFPARAVLIVFYCIMVPAMVLASGAYGVSLLALVAIVVAIEVGTQPLVDSFFSRFIPPEWLSTAFGLRFALSLGASAVAVPAVGLIFDRTGDFTWLFLLLAIAAAIVLVAVLFLPTRAPGDKEPAVKPASAPVTAVAGGG